VISTPSTSLRAGSGRILGLIEGCPTKISPRPRPGLPAWQLMRSRSARAGASLEMTVRRSFNNLLFTFTQVWCRGGVYPRPREGIKPSPTRIFCHFEPPSCHFDPGVRRRVRRSPGKRDEDGSFSEGGPVRRSQGRRRKAEIHVLSNYYHARCEASL